MDFCYFIGTNHHRLTNDFSWFEQINCQCHLVWPFTFWIFFYFIEIWFLKHFVRFVWIGMVIF